MDAIEMEKMVLIVIKAIREYLGHSLKQMAEQLEMPEEMYIKMENGDNKLNIGEVHQIAEAMGFHISFFFSVAMVYHNNNLKNLTRTELEEKEQMLWQELWQEMQLDGRAEVDGYDFFRTNLAPILLHIQRTQKALTV